MQSRELASRPYSKTRSPRQSVGLREKKAPLVLQRDPLARGLSSPATIASVGACASVLNRATDSRPSRAERSLLQLQRQYGNRYVRRVVILSRKVYDEAGASPDEKAWVQRQEELDGNEEEVPERAREINADVIRASLRQVDGLLARMRAAQNRMRALLRDMVRV